MADRRALKIQRRKKRKEKKQKNNTETEHDSCTFFDCAGNTARTVWRPVSYVLHKVEKPMKVFFNWIYEPRTWERKNNAQFYRRTGFKTIKKPYKKLEDCLEDLTRKLPWEKLHLPKIEDVKKDCNKTLLAYEIQTRFYEAFCWKMSKWVGASAGIVAYSSHGLTGLAAVVSAWIPLLGMPLVISRYNRARIYNFLEKREHKRGLPSSIEKKLVSNVEAFEEYNWGNNEQRNKNFNE